MQVQNNTWSFLLERRVDDGHNSIYVPFGMDDYIQIKPISFNQLELILNLQKNYPLYDTTLMILDLIETVFFFVNKES